VDRPVLLTTLGALGGVVTAAFAVGIAGLDINEHVIAPLSRLSLFAAPAPAAQPIVEPTAPGEEGAFAFCLRKGGANPERVLRDLLAYHDHEATLALTECLINVQPQRFCPPYGGRAAADAMEIYLWARDDARIGSPAHGLADKIRILDREAQTGTPAPADPFALNWLGPRDKALFEKLRSLAQQGYLDPGAFAYSGRAELREALRDVKPLGSPCMPIAHND
jgi:hypothetical protein